MKRNFSTMLIAAALTLGCAAVQAQTVINFDNYSTGMPIRSGAPLNNVYAQLGVKLYTTNGGSVYAWESISALSKNCVITPYFDPSHGGSFDESMGVIEAEFVSPVSQVSIYAQPIHLSPEGFLGPPKNKAYLRAYDANGQLLGIYYYPLAWYDLNYGQYQKLTVRFSDNRIKFVQFSSQYSFPTYKQNNGPAVPYFFDNLSFSRTRVSIQLSTPSLAGSNTLTGTVTLLNDAPAEGAVVWLSSSNPAAAVPASVRVPAGQKTATFTVTTSPVNQDTGGKITATFDEASTSANLTVRVPTISTLQLSASQVKGGSSLWGTITLNGYAASMGVTVKLRVVGDLAVTPATVTVAPGFKTVAFPIQTSRTNAPVNVLIMASSGTIGAATLTITP